MTAPRRLFLMLLVLVALVGGGTLGYWLIEDDYTLFDALYMTVITLTTVGYAEVHPLSTHGRLFTIGLLLGGGVAFLYAATEVIRGIVSGELQDVLGRQRVARNLAEIHDHVIICGFGRMGKFICQEFARNAAPYVVIDRDTESLRDFHLPHGLPLVGDATSDDVLRQAGVERARALVVVAASDADNLYVTMSARLLNDKLYIVSRAESEQAEQKLKRAGANRVVSPHAIGGTRVTQSILRPNVVNFLELATHADFYDLQIEEMEIKPGSPLSGISLRDGRLRQEFGVIIVAIKKAAGEMTFNPPGDARMECGDTLIALGHKSQVDQLNKRANGEA